MSFKEGDIAYMCDEVQEVSVAVACAFLFNTGCCWRVWMALSCFQFTCNHRATNVSPFPHHYTVLLSILPHTILSRQSPNPHVTANLRISHHYTVLVLILPYTTPSWPVVAKPPSLRIRAFHRKKLMDTTAPKTVKSRWRKWVEKVDWKGEFRERNGLIGGGERVN